MRRIIVKAYEVGFVLRRGRIIDLLLEGKFWVGFGKEVRIYSTKDPIIGKDILEILPDNENVRQVLRFEKVSDNELGFEMKNGLFNRVVLPGTLGYFNGPVEYELIKVDLNDFVVPSYIPRSILRNPQVLPYVRAYTVANKEKGILYADGKFIKMLDPGAYFYWVTDAKAFVTTVDTRTQTMEVAGQEILTRDKAGIRVNFQTEFQVIDVEKAMIENKDYQKQLYSAMQLTLREYLGSLTLDQLLANKETIGPYVVKETAATAERLGLKVLAGGIKDIILPGDIKTIMNQVLVAQKTAQANTIMRQEETASTRSLLNTAKLMEDNTMLLKLKEMEYMEKIADKIGEITVNGGGGVLNQLQELLTTK